LGAGRLRRNLGLDRATADRGAAATLLLLVVDDNGLGDRGAPARLFLGPTARFGLGLQPRFLLRLAARGFGALAGAPLLFLGAAPGFFCRALAILYLANLRVLERPAAGLHFLGRQLVEHDAAGRRNGRSGTRCLGRGRGSGLRLRNVGARLEDARHLRALVRPRELPLLGLDDDGLRPSVRKALAHGALLHAGALQRQRLLGADAQGLVVTGLRIAHSVSSAAFSIVRPAATRLRASELVPGDLSSAATRFSAALPASPASRAACITFVAPNAKPNSDSEKSLCAG